MYDTLYAILNNSENATLEYFIFFKKALDEKYLLKPNNQQAIRRSSTNLSRLMSELIPFLSLKLYSLNFAIAHPQKNCYAYQNSSYLCGSNTQQNCIIT